MNYHRQNSGRRLALALLFIVALVFADQYGKWFVMETLLRVHEGDVTPPDFLTWFFTEKKLAFFENERDTFRMLTLTPNLNLVMVWNQGISFGLFDTNAPMMPLVFIGLSLAVSMLLLIWFSLARGAMMSVALPLIIGGALGNVIDRVRFAAVADFIDVHLADKHWPAFNLADSCVVAGAVLLALALPGGKKAPTEHPA
jgi:signal peptidase II